MTTIRLATAADAPHIQAIYAPYVSAQPTSFELEPPSEEEMRRRIMNTLERWPWLVCEREGEVLGYAYASKHRDRAAYQWSVDVSVYNHDRARRHGVGRALYTSLLQLLILQKYHNAYAGITLPNPASVGLHEAMGFTPVGVYRAVGHKMGAWHDVGWWELHLQPHDSDPAPLIDFDTLRASPACAAALAAGEAFLHL